MSSYLESFNTHSEYESAKSTLDKPNVSYCKMEDEVHFNPITPLDEYFTFEIISGGTIVWKASSTATTLATISYSLDEGETWTNITSSTSGTSFNVSDGDKVMFKGDNTSYGATTSAYNTFSGSTATFNVRGNIMSLITSQGYSSNETLTNGFTFTGLIRYTKVVDAKHLLLPATTLANYCYYNLFQGCAYLTTAPELPSTTLFDSCYNGMFDNCTRLTVAPELPATTLASYCYNYMFVACRSLTTAPELPATTLANYCYSRMFQGCTSLTAAPELSATTLKIQCYSNMFQNCTSLNSITCLATNISATNCLKDWVSGVASSGTFTKAASMTSWPSGNNGIPNGWTVVDAA